MDHEQNVVGLSLFQRSAVLTCGRALYSEPDRHIPFKEFFMCSFHFLTEYFYLVHYLGAL